MGEKVLGWSAQIVKRPRRWVRVPKDQEPPSYPKGFIVLPRRWVVERTFSWIGQNRRMSKDYERLTETGEAFVYVAMSRLMARRLARVQGFQTISQTPLRLPALRSRRSSQGPRPP